MRYGATRCGAIRRTCSPSFASWRAQWCAPEHAYYIDYRNLRPKYVEAFLDKLVNWGFAEKNFG